MVTGTVFGLFLSFQILTLNGLFGPNRTTFLLSTYTVVSSLVVFCLLTIFVYLLLAGFEKISSIEIRKRGITVILLTIFISILAIRSVDNWEYWAGNEALSFSILSALLAISIPGILYALFRSIFSTSASRTKMVLALIVFLGVFSFSLRHHGNLWKTTINTDPATIPTDHSDRKALIIGLDAATWHVMDRLIESDLLPNIEGIMDEGVYGPMETIQPTHSAILWTSIITGKHHRKHGVIGFTYFLVPGIRDPMQVKGTFLENLFIVLRRYGIVSHSPFTILPRKSDAFWNILAHGDHSIGIMSQVGLASGLAEKVDGFMISSLFKGVMGEPPAPETVWPDSIYEEVIRFNQVPVHDSLPSFIKELKTGENGFEEFIRGVEAIERKVSLTISLEKKYDPDIVFFYDHFSDAIQHRFWRFMEPDAYQENTPKEQVELYGKVIDYTYMYLDHAVSRLVEGVGDDRDVFIISDHGMEPGPLTLKGRKVEKLKESKLALNIISAHHDQAPPGIFIAKGEGIRKGSKVFDTRIYDVTPTLLYLFGFPVASDMDGRVLEEIFEETYIARHPQTTIPTYERGDRLGVLPPLRTGADEELLEKYKALGYIQ
jgi:predicted AlkP superfamily phosphohydrolase/phosphomutase